MYQVTVSSDLVSYGLTEDGEQFIADCYYVQIEADNGERWAHYANFPGAVHRQEYDDEIGTISWFEDIRQESTTKAEALAGRVAAHLEAGGSINPEHWRSIDPAYGSEAWQALDNQGYFKARERAEG